MRVKTSFRSMLALFAIAIPVLFSMVSCQNMSMAGRISAKVTELVPIDPQIVQDQDDMTWDDYRPIPGRHWADPALAPPRQMKIALVAIDFPDQPFVITLPKHSDPFGNPQVDPVPREQVPQFYADFYNTPGEVNHGQTINGYWMEQSRGKIGIAKIDATQAARTDRLKSRDDGHLVLVTAMTPTPKGSGKTLTTVALTDALNRLLHGEGKPRQRATAVLREPSMGPVFGMKGGAAGGGRGWKGAK